jgi:uncharacterized cupin superfamily protein
MAKLGGRGDWMSVIVKARAADAVLESAPIPPEWVLEGSPAARSAVLSQSADGTALTVVWDCTAGAFTWRFDGDETVHILEGEVVVDDGGQVHRLSAGDVAFFPAGSWARWDVPAYVKKLAFCRDPLPRPLLGLVRGARKLKAAVAGRARGGGGLAPKPEPARG